MYNGRPWNAGGTNSPCKVGKESGQGHNRHLYCTYMTPKHISPGIPPALRSAKYNVIGGRRILA